MNVAVIGASDKPHRYSYKAVMELKSKGHTAYPVHRRVKEIGGIKVFPSLSDIKEDIDTVTLYVASDVSAGLEGEIIAAHPRRVIFNPGAENPPLAEALRKNGIEPVTACTLVMLRTGQF